MMIKDLETLKIFFHELVKTPIFGVGVHAFNRLGLADIVSDFRVLTLRYSLDTELIEKDLEVFALEKRLVQTEAFVADRSQMKYDIIVGRRDIKRFLVDPAKNVLMGGQAVKKI